MTLFQVNRLLCKRHCGFFLRHLNIDNGTPKKLFPLKSRKLLKISGTESSVFLQGLITNDMRHFEEGARSMYTMFLNNKGRVLYDTLLYKWEDDTTFMIECDKAVLMLLQKHLALYKLKRMINIEDVNNQLRLLVVPSACDLTDSKDLNNKVFLYRDPRLHDLGFRIIADSSLDDDDVAKTMGLNFTVANDDSEYKCLRYRLGVSEGSEDLPPGTSFPLEVNCDYLHGVSFHKGCYIGQELTARVHHTGVVRKRIMPIKFLEPVHEEIQDNTTIVEPNKPKSNLGKLKGYINDCGIGLIRIKEALEAKELTVGNKRIQVSRPSWWPMEAPKEKIVTKN